MLLLTEAKCFGENIGVNKNKEGMGKLKRGEDMMVQRHQKLFL